MSHEIEFMNGKAQMAWAGETPWHGLGTEVPADLTPQQILEAAGLNWKVRTLPVNFDGRSLGLGSHVKVPGSRVLVRETDGQVLSMVSKDWEPVQNEEAFAFFDDLVRRGNMQMHTAGSLRQGKKVWALAKLQEEFELRVNGRRTRDVTEGYLLLTNPHEYGKSLDARFTAIRVVCNNTHTLAMGRNQSVTSVSLNHRKKFDAARLHELLGTAHIKMDEYKELAEFLASRRYTKETVKKYFSDLLPTGKFDEETDADGNVVRTERVGKIAETAYNLLEVQPGHEFAPGSWWQAFQAFTFVTDHVMGRTADARLDSAWYGLNRGRKQTALNLAREMADAS